MIQAALRGDPEPDFRRGEQRGEAILLRLQPDMLARLDKHRGSATRPQAIRQILDKGLGR